VTRLSSLPENINERTFQAAIVELARLAGWRTYHTFDSRRSESGFPDLCMTRGGRLLAVELKAMKGKVSLAQREWLAALASCPGVEVHIWRPGDWDEIERTLRRGHVN